MEPVLKEKDQKQAEDKVVEEDEWVGTGPVQVLMDSVFALFVEKKYRIRQECPAISLNVQNADNS